MAAKLYLFSIHEKANRIAIFWTERPHSLGSCHFLGVWPTCLLREGGCVPLSALLKNTTIELAGLFSTTSPKCRAPSREAVDTIFESLLVRLDKGIEPQVYRLRSGRSNHYAIAPVFALFCLKVKILSKNGILRVTQLYTAQLCAVVQCPQSMWSEKIKDTY